MVALQEKIIPKVLESIDVLLVLNVLFSFTQALKLLEFETALSVHLVKALLAMIGKPGHEAWVLRALLVVLGVFLQIVGGSVR